MLELRKITNDNVWKICALSVHDHQSEFVADNKTSIAEAYATVNEGHAALPLGIYDGDTPIGFVMIGKGAIDDDESEMMKKSYCLWRFMIDKRYQKKGYGLQALDAVMALVRTYPFGKADKIWLSYEPENVRAKEIYRKYGFVENGEVCDGETVAVMDIV